MSTLTPFAKPADLRLLLPALSDDAAVLALDVVSGAIRGSLGWDVDRVVGATYAQVVPRGRAPLKAVILPALNVEAVASVVVDDVTLPASGYDATPAGVVYLHDSSVHRKVTVTYTAGYVRAPEDEAPPVLRTVALDYAAQLALNPDGVASYTMGQVSETLAADARRLADDDTRLDPHRVVT